MLKNSDISEIVYDFQKYLESSFSFAFVSRECFVVCSLFFIFCLLELDKPKTAHCFFSLKIYPLNKKCFVQSIITNSVYFSYVVVHYFNIRRKKNLPTTRFENYTNS